MPSEGDVVFAQLLAVHHLATDQAIRDGLAACDRIAEMGVTVNLAEILVAREVIDVPKANEIARVQLRKTHIGLLRTHLATLHLTREEDKRIGNMAAHNGLVTQEQLDDALRIQAALKEEKLEKALGVIMADKAYLAPEVVESLLELQAVLKSGPQPDTPMILAHEDLTFCAVAVERKLLTHDQAQHAIATQRHVFEKVRLRQPMTEVVYGLKLMQPEPIQEVSREVADRRKGVRPPPVNVLELSVEQDTRLGALLVERGLAAPNQVQTCVDVQKRLRSLGMDRKLGEVLMMMGFATRDDLLAAMAAQRQRRAGATTAAPTGTVDHGVTLASPVPIPRGPESRAEAMPAPPVLEASFSAVLEDEPSAPPVLAPTPGVAGTRRLAAVSPAAPATRAEAGSDDSAVEVEPMPDAPPKPAGMRRAEARRPAAPEPEPEPMEKLPPPPRARPASGTRMAVGRASSGVRRPVAGAPSETTRLALMLAGAGILMAAAGLGGYLASRAATQRGSANGTGDAPANVAPAKNDPAHGAPTNGPTPEDPAARLDREARETLRQARELTARNEPERALELLEPLRAQSTLPSDLRRALDDLRESAREKAAERLFTQAQALRDGGDKAGAVKLLERVAEEFSGTLYEDAARRQLLELSGAGGGGS